MTITRPIAIALALATVAIAGCASDSQSADPTTTTTEAPATTTTAGPVDDGVVTAMDIAEAMIAAGIPLTQVTDISDVPEQYGVDELSNVSALIDEDYAIDIAIWPTQESADEDVAATRSVDLLVAAQCGTTVVFYFEGPEDAEALAQWTAPIEAVLEELVGPCP